MKTQDDFLKISTPENVAFSYPVAGIGSRFIAALVDTALILLLQGVVIVFSALFAGMFVDFSGDIVNEETFTAWIIGGFGLVSFVFLWGYYIFFEMVWNGQSPGKRAVKLRVIRSDGGAITLTESITRNLIRLVDFLPMIYGVGVVVMFIDSKARRLGDLAAGTIVVRMPEAVLTPPLPLRHRSKMPEIEGLGILPVERLLPEDLDLIEAFLKRKSDLSMKDELANQILEKIFQRFDLPAPSPAEYAVEHLLKDILAAGRLHKEK